MSDLKHGESLLLPRPLLFVWFGCVEGFQATRRDCLSPFYTFLGKSGEERRSSVEAVHLCPSRLSPSVKTEGLSAGDTVRFPPGLSDFPLVDSPRGGLGRPWGRGVSRVEPRLRGVITNHGRSVRRGTFGKRVRVPTA